MSATPGVVTIAKIGAVGLSTAFSQEACSLLGGGESSYLNYKISANAKSLWDPTATFVVEVSYGGGYTTADPSTYTLHHLFGVITFNDATDALVRVTGKYLPTYAVTTACEKINLRLPLQILEATTMNSLYAPFAIAGRANAEGTIDFLESPAYDWGTSLDVEIATYVENATTCYLEVNFTGSESGDYPSGAWRGFVKFKDLTSAADQNSVIKYTVAFQAQQYNSVGKSFSWYPTLVLT